MFLVVPEYWRRGWRENVVGKRVVQVGKRTTWRAAGDWWRQAAHDQDGQVPGHFGGASDHDLHDDSAARSVEHKADYTLIFRTCRFRGNNVEARWSNGVLVDGRPGRSDLRKKCWRRFRCPRRTLSWQTLSWWFEIRESKAGDRFHFDGELWPIRKVVVWWMLEGATIVDCSACKMGMCSLPSTSSQVDLLQ